MPFTIAHAAAAPPLWRLTGRRLVLSAAVVGSLAPDLEYLVHLRTHRTIGHTVVGIFVLCVPLTLALLWLWHRLVGPHLSRLLPERWAPLAAAASRPFGFFPSRRFLAVCLSAAAGAASHQLWDAFTHRGGYPVAHLALLRESVWPGGPAGYRLLQYFSSLVGLGALGCWLSDLARRPGPVAAPRPPLPTRVRWTGTGALVGLVALAAGANALRLAAGGWAGPRDVAVAGLVGAMAGTVLAAVVVSGALARRSLER